MGKMIAIALLSLAVASSCGCGATRPSKYYELRTLSELTPQKPSEVYPVTLVLGPLAAPHLYREDRLVFSSGQVELGTYQYQRWASPLTEMIQETLLRDLSASGRYREVLPLSSASGYGDFLLRGHLYDFKEVSGPTVLARVTMEFELHNMKSNSTVWTFFYTHDEPVTSKDVSHVVSALDQNAQRCATEFMTKLDEYFASHPAQWSAQTTARH